MKRIGAWIWRQGVVSTFMTGFFVLLPIMITIGIMVWVGGWVADLLGPTSFVGRALQMIGLKLLPHTSQWLGSLLGWAVVLGSIWVIGATFKALAKHRMQKRFHQTIEQIPLINVIYKPVAQVVGMLQESDDDQMKSMNVVYCSFGQAHGGGFLALLASPQVFRFDDQDCYTVYIPTSPVPMSGGIVFVPVGEVKEVDMQVDDLMQIYFSLGVMAARVVPEEYRVAS